MKLIDDNGTEKTLPKTYVNRCVIRLRDGDEGFRKVAPGVYLPRLDGYAIITAEEYKLLQRAVERLRGTASTRPSFAAIREAQDTLKDLDALRSK